MTREAGRRKVAVISISSVVAGLVSALLASAPVGAALIARYQMLDHPDASESPPPYGLRLDEMGSIPGPGALPAGEYLFSAELNGSHLTLDVLEDDVSGLLSIHIYGTMYGGLQDDSAADHLDAIFKGVAVIDFTYRQNVTPGSGGVLYTVTGDAHDLTTGNTGTVEWTDESGDTHTIHLQDQSGASFSARLADGHRAGPGIRSCWGWVNDSTLALSTAYDYVDSSDWLLTVEPVHMPEPATWLCLGAGLAAVGAARRRSAPVRL